MPLHRIDNKIVLFVHIPKTGGSTIEKWLAGLGPSALKHPGKYEGLQVAPQHFHAALLKRIMPPDFYDDAFCIVRDPLERLLSEYRWCYRRRAKLPTGWAGFLPGANKEMANTRHFRKWVAGQISRTRKDPVNRGNHLRPQSDFLGVEGCRIYRFEDGFDQIMSDLAARWSIRQPDIIPHANASRKTNFSVDAETRRMIDTFYAEDFEKLGYEKSSDRI